MANTLTNLIPDAYVAMNYVSRELVGLIPAVTLNAEAARAAVGQAVRSYVVPAMAATNITPAVTPPNDGDMTIGSNTLTITKARRVPFRWNGEEQRGLSFGHGNLTIQQDQIAQAIRTLVNEIETDIAALHTTFSRAYGTAGTTPFASNTGETAQLKKILDDNGCPADARSLVMNTTAGASLRTLANLTRVSEAGTDQTLRNGVLLDLNGLALRESAAIVAGTTVGTAAGATTNAAGYAVGTTTLTLAAAGTGTILAGDIITFAGDTNKYLVVTGNGNVAAGGTIVIATPGLQVAMSAATKAITVVGTAARNMAFRKQAIHLAQRLPALPDGGDMAVDRTTIVDPLSGLAFEIAQYAQYRQMQWEISCAWGVANMKPEHTALLLG